MASVIYAGTFIGMVIAMSTCGILAQSFGWESIFYVFGGLGIVWWFFWAAIVRDCPDNDRHITEEEKHFIKASMQHSESQKHNIPWLAIFTSPAVYAIAMSHFAENWGVYTMLTQLPLFLKRKLLLSVERSELIDSLSQTT